MTQKLDISSAEVAEMYESGKTITEIAKHFGCTYPPIKKRLNQAGCAIRKNPKKGKKYGHVVHKHIDIKDVIDLYVNKKLSMRDVGKKLGCSAPTISSFLREAGIKRRHHNDTKRGAVSPRRYWIDPERVLHHYSKIGVSAAAVARIFGVSVGVINRIIEAEGVQKKPVGEGYLRFGDKNPNYNPNLTDAERDGARRNYDASKWREAVFSRDGYVCRCCGYDKGGILEAHHVVPYSKDRAIRWDVDNGITMCKKCHRAYHRAVKLNDCSKETLDQYIKDNQL